MGGIKLNEPAADLAVALALASSHKGTPIPKEVCAFGEIGLTGEVRPVMRADKRVAECVRLGAKKIYLPQKNMDAVKKYADKVTLVPVKHIYAAVKELFG